MPHEMKNLYFVECAALSSIKVGTTIDVAKRVKTLQAGNSSPLVTLLSVRGSLHHEERIHDHFHDEWIRGEWFHNNGELRAFIAMLKARASRSRTALMDSHLRKLSTRFLFARHTGRGNVGDRMEPRS